MIFQILVCVFRSFKMKRVSMKVDDKRIDS